MAVTTREHISNNFYVYVYLRSKDSATAPAGTPYYVGKGKGRRAFESNRKYKPKDPNCIVLIEQNVTEAEAFDLERLVISMLGRKDIGTGILWNRTDGGEGISGAILSEETKAKMSNSRKGKRLSEETKRKISKSHKGKTQRPRSEETKIKISLANKGKKLSETHIKKIVAVHTGKIRSEETKMKISIAKKGVSLSEEHKKKLSEAGKRRTHSEESRDKMRQSWILRKQQKKTESRINMKEEEN